MKNLDVASRTPDNSDKYLLKQLTKLKRSESAWVRYLLMAC